MALMKSNLMAATLSLERGDALPWHFKIGRNVGTAWRDT